MNKVYTRFGIEVKDLNGCISTSVYNLSKEEDFYYAFVGLEILDIKSFINDMEANIHKQKEEIIKSDKYAFNLLISNDYNLAHRVDVRYPHLLRNSIFISIYSLLEDSLIKLCSYYKNKKDIDAEIITKEKIPIINHAKRFIESNAKILVPEEEWILISEYRKLRNSIAHNRGYIVKNGKADNRNILKAIKSLSEKGINISENQRGIELDETACVNFIETVESFFYKLCFSLIPITSR